jgi:hypothetical protein
VQGVPLAAVHPIGDATVRPLTNVGSKDLPSDATTVLHATGTDLRAISVPRHL